MTRRRLLLFAAAACLLLAAPFVVRWATTPTPGVTEENFRRLHTDMHIDEIEARMGRPADDRHFSRPKLCSLTWKGDNGEVGIVMHQSHAASGVFRRPDGTEMQLAIRAELFIDIIHRWIDR